MGKGTDKLFITHGEWASEDAFSASSGSGVSRAKAARLAFKCLPFNYCALSLQPLKHPVSTANGTIFDLTNILPWLKKHGTNPVDGQPLRSSELIKLNFAKNDDGEYVDPVTFKVFTDNTHIVALRNTGNVFAWDTIERLNIKAKNWHDLVSDDEFSRKDIITLQDPQHMGARDLNSFKYLVDGTSTLTDEQERESNDPTKNLNIDAMGSAAKIIKAKEAVIKARVERDRAMDSKRGNNELSNETSAGQFSRTGNVAATPQVRPKKSAPYNAAQHTTGKAAASFTSTGLTPHTSNERALLSDEEYMLKPRQVKIKGYARMQTNLGDINVELETEYAPKAVWNFIQLSKNGYYRNMPFHRNIRNFMIQGGDPTGTGRGGTSIWSRPFADEFDGPLTHDSRGILSMANKGKNTNTSQFFITYRAAKHLDRKHTIFGKVVEGMETLSRLENVKVGEGDRPIEECILENLSVYVDPFEEFMNQKAERDKEVTEKDEVLKQGGTEDDMTTWTGKRIRPDGSAEPKGIEGGVGKYLNHPTGTAHVGLMEEADWDADAVEEPVKKRANYRGFGNFDNW